MNFVYINHDIMEFFKLERYIEVSETIDLMLLNSEDFEFQSFILKSIGYKEVKL